VHTFTPTADGLVETVETTAAVPGGADGGVDPAQVEAIRAHLRQEAERFGAGDFSDPARIHGDDMPGLAELRAGHDRLDVAYTEVAAGARLTYTSADPALVAALHAWGRAQSMDHGR
jgi:hypothetical protein